MEIVLLKDVPKIGKKGDVKVVSDGYAKNFLINKGLAVIATQELKTKLSKEAKEKSAKQIKQQQNLQKTKQELEKRVFTIKIKLGKNGKTFGAASGEEVLQAIFQKTKIKLDKSVLPNLHNLKTTGLHQLEFKLGGGVKANIKINLEPNAG